VAKVQHKPIKSPRKGSNKKSKRQPKAALVWRTGLSGVPLGSVRCTREINSELATFGFLELPSAIIHRTVRCAKRSNGYSANGRLQKVHHRTVRWPSCQKLQRSNPNSWVTWLAHRIVSGGAPDCPVRPSTAAFPNGHFGGWGYKDPQPPTL
jgi:hypothetical protein